MTDQAITVAIAGFGNRGWDAYGKRILEMPGEIKPMKFIKHNTGSRYNP